jgi:hypothetical protein
VKKRRLNEAAIISRKAELIKLFKDMPERHHYLEYDGVGYTESVTGHENPLVMRQMAMDWFKRFL